MDKVIWDGHQSTRDPTMGDRDAENPEKFQEEISAEMERNEDMADNEYEGATGKGETC